MLGNSGFGIGHQQHQYQGWPTWHWCMWPPLAKSYYYISWSWYAHLRQRSLWHQQHLLFASLVVSLLGLQQLTTWSRSCSCTLSVPSLEGKLTTSETCSFLLLLPAYQSQFCIHLYIHHALSLCFFLFLSFFSLPVSSGGVAQFQTYIFCGCSSSVVLRRAPWTNSLVHLALLENPVLLLQIRYN